MEKSGGWIVLLLVVIAGILLCQFCTTTLSADSPREIVVVQATAVPTEAPTAVPVPTATPNTAISMLQFSCRAVDYTITAIGLLKGHCPWDITDNLGLDAASFSLQDGKTVELNFSQLNGRPSWSIPAVEGSLWPWRAPEKFSCFGSWDPKTPLTDDGTANVSTPALITCTHGNIKIQALIAQVILLQNFLGSSMTEIP